MEKSDLKLKNRNSGSLLPGTTGRPDTLVRTLKEKKMNFKEIKYFLQKRSFVKIKFYEKNLLKIENYINKNTR